MEKKKNTILPDDWINRVLQVCTVLTIVGILLYGGCHQGELMPVK